MSSLPRRWKLFLVLAPLTILVDQLTKLWARHSLPTVPDASGRMVGKAVPVIENFFDWRLSHNPGSAFGLFGGTSGARIFLSIVGVIAVVAIVWMLKKARDDQTRLIIALGLVAGGAIGNLIDRIYNGIVTDFVVWKYYQHEWPTFNVADVALVVGVGLLFLDIGKESQTAEDPPAGGEAKPTRSAPKRLRKKRSR